MRVVDLIKKKRDGYELNQAELDFLVKGYSKNEIRDYHISAFLMAVYFQGMTDEEAANLTLAMVKSGAEIDLSAISGIKVDKHSTGGVGDTTTLVLCPLVAALGVPVAKMSGRGLGHTGGTLDKLEAVPGFSIEITNEDFIKLVNDNKLAVIGQTDNLTPADKKLYALRDVTATVDSIPLIASSIMSKKIAAGTDAIVLDVKTGSGAFMKTYQEARQLAEMMVKIGNNLGRKTRAIISNMDQPLGRAIGNSLEIEEAILTLSGKGPADLEKLSLTLGAEMVYASQLSSSKEEAFEKLQKAIQDGSALNKFKDFLSSQGGDARVVDDFSLLPKAKFEFNIPSPKTGYINEIITEEIGRTAMLLGAGRASKADEIDLSVGLVLEKKVGDYVNEGDSLVKVYANKKDISWEITNILKSIKIDSKPPEIPELIYEIIG